MKKTNEVNIFLRIEVMQKTRKLYLNDVVRIKKLRKKRTPPIPQFQSQENANDEMKSTTYDLDTETETIG